MKKAKHFEFLFPITDMGHTPPLHVEDLTVHAIVYQFPDGTLHRDPQDNRVTVDIDTVLFRDKNISLLLQAVATDTYDEIIEAARSHGTDKFEIVTEEFENGAGELEAEEKWVHDQWENQLMSHE
jgi:hypothetical protein